MTEAADIVTPGRQVVVVGGSLVGLSMAIALARRGAAVTVLERTPRAGYEGGGGLGVDLGLLARVTGLADSPPVCRGRDRATTAWPLLAGWLEEHALAVPAIEVQRAAEVVEVGGGSARLADGRHFSAELSSERAGPAARSADGCRRTARTLTTPASCFGGPWNVLPYRR
jgi:glycine/D-amino acid oxidase-like deaminating enzyme